MKLSTILTSAALVLMPGLAIAAPPAPPPPPPNSASVPLTGPELQLLFFAIADASQHCGDGHELNCQLGAAAHGLNAKLNAAYQQIQSHALPPAGPPPK